MLMASNRLFSPYVQTEIGRRQGGKGSGLGLALVRQIVKLSHGRLGVESTFGKGTCIWFELPYSLPRNKDRAGGSYPPPVHVHDFGNDPQPDAGLQVHPPYPPPMPRWYSYHHPRRDDGQDNEAHEGNISLDTALTTSSADRSTDRERPSVMTTDSTRPLLQSSMSTIGTGVQLQQYTQLMHQPGGMGVPMDPKGQVELDGIQAAVFPAVRGLSDASASSSASAGTGGGDSVASLRNSTASDALSPEVVVIDKKDPFSVVSPPGGVTPLPVPMPRGIVQSGKRRSSEWRRDVAQSSALSRVDDADAARTTEVPVPVSPKTPRDGEGGMMSAQQKHSAQGQGRMGVVSEGVNEDERPLCTLVVDDDK